MMIVCSLNCFGEATYAMMLKTTRNVLLYVRVFEECLNIDYIIIYIHPKFNIDTQRYLNIHI